EARDRHALRARQLAGDRLHLRDILRGENGAGGPTARDPRAPEAAPHGSALASARRPPAPTQACARSRHSTTPLPRTRPSSLAAPPCAAACSRPPDAQAGSAPQRSTRSRAGSSLPPPTTFAALAANSSPNETELTAGSTKLRRG